MPSARPATLPPDNASQVVPPSAEYSNFTDESVSASDTDSVNSSSEIKLLSWRLSEFTRVIAPITLSYVKLRARISE